MRNCSVWHSHDNVFYESLLVLVLFYNKFIIIILYTYLFIFNINFGTIILLYNNYVLLFKLILFIKYTFTQS